MSMNDHKARAKAICMSTCSSVACRCADTCAGRQFDPLLGAMPAWWDYLPDGGEGRRSALADLLGRDMIRSLTQRIAGRPQARADARSHPGHRGSR